MFRFVLLLVLLISFGSLFFVPEFIARYKKGEYVGTEAQELLSSLDILSPAAGSGEVVGAAHKYLPSAKRFTRKKYVAQGIDPSFAQGFDYFIFSPAKPWPEALKFPLVIHLHDKDTPAYSAEYLTHPQMELEFPAFSIVPLFAEVYGEKNAISGSGMNQNTLASPSDFIEGGQKHTNRLSLKEVKAYHNGSTQKSQSVVPALIGLIRFIAEDYPVDKDRIYITGCGYGGLSMFKALEQEPELFSAALSVSAGWHVKNVENLKATPMVIFNGTQNSKFPVVGTKMLAKGLERVGAEVIYTEYESMAHNCSYTKFYSPHVWEWMFSHK